MVNTSVRSLNTPLRDRVLWFDGDSAYSPAQLLHAIRSRDVRFVTEPNPLVDEYNKHVAASQEIHVKTECGELTYDWNIPPAYKHLDVEAYLFSAHSILFEGCDSAELEEREVRLATELVRYRKHGLYDVIRAVIWIINTLSSNDVVWGVGRGSSVSSYVLYVIGVHDVDSYTYDLDIDDFLQE